MTSQVNHSPRSHTNGIRGCTSRVEESVTNMSHHVQLDLTRIMNQLLIHDPNLLLRRSESSSRPFPVGNVSIDSKYEFKTRNSSRSQSTYSGLTPPGQVCSFHLVSISRIELAPMSSEKIALASIFTTSHLFCSLVSSRPCWKSLALSTM